MLHNFNIDDSVSMPAKTAVLNAFIDGFETNYNNRYIDYLIVSPTFGSSPFIGK